MATGWVLEEEQGLPDGLLVLLRRSRVMDDWSWGCARAEMMGGRGLPLARMASRTDFISGGMGMLCTMLTVGQSAGCMSRCSGWVGARQQPGQPWLLYTVSFGFRRAHCSGRGEDGGDRRGEGVDLAVAAAVEGLYFGVLEMDDVDAGMVGSVVADVAEVGTAGGGSASGGGDGTTVPGSAWLEHLAHGTGHGGDVGGGVVLVAHLGRWGRRRRRIPRWILICTTPKKGLSSSPSTMGKSQSKLSPEQLADLQKNTYCTHIPQTTTTEHSHPQSTRENYSNGILVPHRPSDLSPS
jgi:hypothetical protein